MEINLIHTEADYAEALAEIERLFDAASGTPEADRLQAGHDPGVQDIGVNGIDLIWRGIDIKVVKATNAKRTRRA